MHTLSNLRSALQKYSVSRGLQAVAGSMLAPCQLAMDLEPLWGREQLVSIGAE